MRTPREHFAIREEALTLATTQLAIQLQLININFERIKETEWELVRHAWRRHPVRKGLQIEFNWLAHRNKRRDKLDVSIWSQGVLCGLFLAKLSRKSINVALRYLESNPYCHPLSGKVIPVGLIIAESFAVSYGAYQVMVYRPERLQKMLVESARPQRSYRNWQPDAELEQRSGMHAGSSRLRKT